MKTERANVTEDVEAGRFDGEYVPEIPLDLGAGEPYEFGGEASIIYEGEYETKESFSPPEGL